MKIKSHSIDDKILKSMRATKSASVFKTQHFLQFGNSAAIRQALARLTKDGKIRRIRPGLYDLPQEHPIIGQAPPDPMAVVKALMEGSSAQWQVSGAYAANLLGLSEQVPAKIEILTDGISRKMKLGRLEIAFKHASPKNLLGAGTLSGTVVQAIRYLKEEGLGDAKILQLRNQLDDSTKKDLMKISTKLPAWMQPIAKRITEQHT